MWSIAHGITQSGIALLFGAATAILGAWSEYVSTTLQELTEQLAPFSDEKAETYRSLFQCNAMDFERVTRGKNMTCADWSRETNQRTLGTAKVQEYIGGLCDAIGNE